MDLLWPFLEKHFENTNPFVFVQAMMIFYLVWRKIKPHLDNIEKRFSGIENQLSEMKNAVTAGFANGELRFKNLENRVDKLENN